MAKFKWNENGWNSLQEPDAKKHVLSIDCLAKNGQVVEVRVRHHDGEEYVAKVTVAGKPVLPLDIPTFQKHFDKYELELNR